MSITVAQAVNTLENVLFESPTLASANAVSAKLSSFSTVAAYAQYLTSTPEFAITAQVVRYYTDALGRVPSGSEVAYYVNLAENGNATAGIAPMTAAQIAAGTVPQATWNTIATFFASSPEFQTDFGLASANAVSTANQAAMIASFYSNILGRTASSAEVNYYENALDNGFTPADLVQFFSNSPEFLADASSKIQSDVVAYASAIAAGTATASTAISSQPLVTPLQIYTIAHDSQSSLTEGATETFSITTKNVAAGTVLDYTLAGVTASEIVGGHLSGTVTIGADGTATLMVALTAGAGQGVSGSLTASLATSVGGTTVASTSVPLIETQASTFVTLGDLGGGTASTTAFAINDSGMVAGFSGIGDGAAGIFKNAGGSDHAYVWQNGMMTDLGLLSGDTQAEAWSINDNGEVVGWSIATSAGITGGHAFIYENGTLTDLGTMAGALISQARGVNDYGQIVGQSNSVAFLWQPGTQDGTTGTYFALGTIDGFGYSMATSINKSGEVVGYLTNLGGSSYEAFLWTPTSTNGTAGTMINLGAAAGQSNAQAVAINDSGEVIGTATDASGNTVSWSWTPSAPNATTGTMTALAVPTGGANITANAINDAGLIVGEALVPATIAGQVTTIDHAFLWKANGSVIDLNSYLPAGSLWTLETANGINASGQIVGEAIEIGRGISATYVLTLPSSDIGAESAAPIMTVTSIIGVNSAQHFSVI